MKPNLTVLIVMLLLAGTGFADTYTWTLTDVPVRTTVPVEMDANFLGITRVEVAMSGFSGGQRGWCEVFPEGYPLYLPYEFTLDLNGAVGIYHSSYREDFETVFELQLTPQQPDWTFLEDGLAELEITIDDNYTFDYVKCVPTGYETPRIDQLEIRVTAGVVPAARARWGTIKAMYK